MSVTIHKKSEAQAEAQAEVVEEVLTDEAKLRQQVDSYGSNATEIKTIKDHLKGYEAENKLTYSDLQTVVDGMVAPTEEKMLSGDKFKLLFKAHGNMGKMTDSHQAFEMLEGVKEGLGWQLMSFSLTELKKYLTPSQFDKVTVYEAKKARVVNVFENDA